MVHAAIYQYKLDADVFARQNNDAVA